MTQAFFDSPILNSPYAKPDRHWQLDENGQPTGSVLNGRRRSDLTTPIPKARTSRGKAQSQPEFFTDERGDVYDPTEIINGIRQAVDAWRDLPESQ